MCGFHAFGAALSRLSGFNCVQSWRESPTLTWIRPWHCGKCAAWLNRRLFSGTPGGCLSVWTAGWETHDPVSAGVRHSDLGSRSTREAICQVEWDLFRKGKHFFAKCFSNQGHKYKGVQTHYQGKFCFFNNWLLVCVVLAFISISYAILTPTPTLFNSFPVEPNYLENHLRESENAGSAREWSIKIIHCTVKVHESTTAAVTVIHKVVKKILSYKRSFKRFRLYIQTGRLVKSLSGWSSCLLSNSVLSRCSGESKMPKLTL